MIGFLKGHFRYHTMNSWNRSTSYANNIKLYNLELPQEFLDKAFEMIQLDEVWSELNAEIRDWGFSNQYLWQVSTNGKSGGYLVLYRGGSKATGHKSCCTRCGQRNFKTIEETKGKRCGRCGQDSRVNYMKSYEPIETFVIPGKGVDVDEDFEDWSIHQLRERVKLVQDFDQLCDDLLAAFVDLCQNYEIVEEQVLVPTKIKTLRAVS